MSLVRALDDKHGHRGVESSPDIASDHNLRGSLEPERLDNDTNETGAWLFIAFVMFYTEIS